MRALSFLSALAGVDIALRGAPLLKRPLAAGSRKRPHSRNRYSGAMLRQIRATGQARECARRLRQRGVL